ncbi:MAG TPA: thrombospondin type 3 repeat-containing protein [bacterium]|nr:thrombospondin type 3 repeat-containing protein [bacterium]
MRIAAASLVALAALCAPLAAQATPNFPPEIQAHLALGNQPPCSLCHLNGVTGLGTVTTPFGVSMRAAGLVQNDITSLDTALDTLQANNTDSDGDGTSDIQELKNGTDPNTANGSGPSTLTPVYGCGGGDLVYPVSPSVAGGTIGVFAFAVAIATRRRRG